MLINKIHMKTWHFTYAQHRNGWIDSSKILHIDSYGDVVTSPKPHQIDSAVWEGWGPEYQAILMTLYICANVHTCDVLVRSLEACFNSITVATCSIDVCHVTMANNNDTAHAYARCSSHQQLHNIILDTCYIEVSLIWNIYSFFAS